MFPESLPWLYGWCRFTVLRSALALAETFEEMAPVAITIVTTGGTSMVDFERGPILYRAFSAGYAPTRPLTSAQRDRLQAFVDTEESASGIGGNWLWLRAVGLPEDRHGIAALL